MVISLVSTAVIRVTSYGRLQETYDVHEGLSAESGKKSGYIYHYEVYQVI